MTGVDDVHNRSLVTVYLIYLTNDDVERTAGLIKFWGFWVYVNLTYYYLVTLSVITFDFVESVLSTTTTDTEVKSSVVETKVYYLFWVNVFTDTYLTFS